MWRRAALWCVAHTALACTPSAKLTPDASLIHTDPGVSLGLDLSGPRGPFSARLAPALATDDRLIVTYMEDVSGLVRRDQQATFIKSLSAHRGAIPLDDEDTPAIWREDPRYLALSTSGQALPAPLRAVGGLTTRTTISKLYHILERPAGVAPGATLVVTGESRAPLARPGLSKLKLDEDDASRAIGRHAAEALRSTSHELAPGSVEVEAVEARLGAGYHVLVIAQAAERVDGDSAGRVVSVVFALDASRRQRRIILEPESAPAWRRWALLRVLDADADGFEEVLVERGGQRAGSSELMLLHIRDLESGAARGYNLCPEVSAGPTHTFFCLPLGSLATAEEADASALPTD
jgi:hypothetical protein